MAGRGAKRKLKKLRRESEESATVVTQCINLLGLHGVVISLPYELVNAVRELAEAQYGTPGAGAISRPAAQQGPSSVSGAMERLQLSFGDPESESVVADLDENKPLSDYDFGDISFDEVPDLSVGSDAGGHLPPISMDAMALKVQASTDKMLDRVAANGVQHKGQGPNPVAGGDGSSAPQRGGRVNRVTGLSREESARLISQATGREVGAPGASPTIKPPR